MKEETYQWKELYEWLTGITTEDRYADDIWVPLMQKKIKWLTENTPLMQVDTSNLPSITLTEEERKERPW